VFVDAGDHFSVTAAIKNSAGTSALYLKVGRHSSAVRDDPSLCDDPAPLDVQMRCETKPVAEPDACSRPPGGAARTRFKPTAFAALDTQPEHSRA
jgi:hypothetical protein